jgi:ureidoglycolate hydrolase
MKVKALTKESFAEFGEVVELPPADGEWLIGDWADTLVPLKIDQEAGIMQSGGDIRVVTVTFKKRPLVLDAMERHLKTAEMVIPAGNPIWLPAAPACEGKEPDPEKIVIFEVQPDQAVIFKAGAWHYGPFIPDSLETVSVFAFYDNAAFDVEIVKLAEPIAVEAP